MASTLRNILCALWISLFFSFGLGFVRDLNTNIRVFDDRLTSRSGMYPIYHPHKSRAFQRETSVLKMVAVAPVKKQMEFPKDIDVHSENWKNLPDIWDTLADKVPQNIAVVDNIHTPSASLTYRQMRDSIYTFAGGLQHLGLGLEQCISVFSENSHRWLIAEQAVMKAGGHNAVRGVSAPPDELQYIYDNSESVAVIVEDERLLKTLMNHNGGLKSPTGKPLFAIVLYPGKKTGQELAAAAGLSADANAINVLTYDEVMDLQQEYRPVEIRVDAPATLVYTSGTTSMPKGVVLRHNNLLHQVLENSFDRRLGKMNPKVGDVFVSILPCWHIFERSAEYFCFARGIQMVYSNIRNFKTDLGKWRPHFLIAVPRLFETIYKGVVDKFDAGSSFKRKLVQFFTNVSMLNLKMRRTMKSLVVREKPPPFLEKAWALLVAAVTWPFVKVADKLVWNKIREGMGGRLKVLVSGGSALPTKIEDFFDMVGQKVLVGYGLTETSPVISNRVVQRNLVGSVGKPPPYTKLKLVDVETGVEVKPGQVGVILAKGPQIMVEYKNNPEATAAAIDKDGFFDTGDLGFINPVTGDLIVTGRAKDTIVLSNGENVPPGPIEDAILGGCPMVEQVMLVGQDQKTLSALVVLNLPELAKADPGLLSPAEAEEVARLIGPRPATEGVKEGNMAKLKEVQDRLQANRDAERLVLDQIRPILSNRKKFKAHEVVSDVLLLVEPFTVPNGLMTQTLKIKRNVVMDRFKKEIEAIYEL